MLFCGWEQRELPLISQTTSKLFFPLLCPQKDEKQTFFNKHLDDELGYPFLIYFNFLGLAY
jgi:hypothetical protein